MKLGYDKPLYLLPFDHRASFTKTLLNIEGAPNKKQTALVVSYKQIVYEGFKKALALGIPKQGAAILVDEEFGAAILKDARANGFTFCLPVEKSGQAEFDFEYGDAFTDHIKKFNPPIVKVLVRYNPGTDPDLNQRQRARLKQLSDFCHDNSFPFLFEHLIPATTQQLNSVASDLERYDDELRPRLTVQAVAELQRAGVEPDIWKMEGFSTTNHYHAVVAQIQTEGRTNVGMIVLGRNADDTQVEHWLKEAAKVMGITGFAVGRTIFAAPLEAVRDGTATREQAIDAIAKKYFHFYQVFTGNHHG